MTLLNMFLALVVGVLLLILFFKAVGFVFRTAFSIIGLVIGAIFKVITWPFKLVFNLLFGWALH